METSVHFPKPCCGPSGNVACREAEPAWPSDIRGRTGDESGYRRTPIQRAVGLFYARVDADPEWYPGKSGQVIHGPAKALTSQQASAIARSAQALKARGVEPTYSRIVSACPNATINHKTGKAVDKKREYDVFRASCREPTWT